MFNRKLSKAKKLVRNPNLFFFDYFKRKVVFGREEVTKYDYSSEVCNEAVLATHRPFSVFSNHDFLNLTMSNLGVSLCDNILSYIHSSYSLIKDTDDVYIWDGYLSSFVNFIIFIKKCYKFKVDIYQPNGAKHFTYGFDALINEHNLIRCLSTIDSFFVELINPLGEYVNFRIHVCNNVSPHEFVVRSNKLPFKKFNVNSVFINKPSEQNIEVDVVYTWVNKDDPEWIDLWNGEFPDDPYDPDRFSSNDELRYSLRSIAMYAEWVRTIYIVSNCHQPKWLDTSDGRVVWVYHNEIYPDSNCLPVFNSHSIETCLHRISGLSEHFIYFNDDVFLTQPCTQSDFFDLVGRSCSFYEPYGMVGGAAIDDITPSYMKAAKNSADIIYDSFGYFPRSLLKHTPHPLRKSVLNEIEANFNDVIERVRVTKLRSDDDISLTSFFYHHYSFVKGYSIPADCNYLLVRSKNYKKAFRNSYNYKFMCLNDGGGDSENSAYKNASLDFMKNRFSLIPSWEVLCF